MHQHMIIKITGFTCGSSESFVNIVDHELFGQIICFEPIVCVCFADETLESTGWLIWYPGQPAGSNQNCGYYQYYTPSKQFGIGDELCTGERPFICEYEFHQN